MSELDPTRGQIREHEPAPCIQCGEPLPLVRSKKRIRCVECQRKNRINSPRGGRRSRTIAPKRLSKEEIAFGQLLETPDVDRPKTRGDCDDMARPCPFVSCKHHLYLDVNPLTGSIKLNFPDLEPWDLKESCALDVADRGGITLEEVGELMNFTRERCRQIEVGGLLKLRMGEPLREVEDE